MTADDAPKAGRREWLGLVVLALPTLLLSLDLSVLHLALPHLSADLGAGSIQQLWIIDIYGFMIAGFLITMGTLGDRLGRRRVLLVGAVAFGAASVMAAYSTSPEMLIGTRALLGIAGATLMPQTLALIMNMFADPKQRGAAIGVWVGCFMGGLALGPIVGGGMLHFFWWGSVFLLGVPVMLLLLVGGPALLPEFRNPDAGRPDGLSVVLSLLAILPVVYGIKELAQGGWGVLPAVSMLVGIVFGLLFVLRQARLSDPLMDLRLFRSRSFSAALVIMLAGATVGGGTILVVNLYLQMVRGLSPLEAGLLMAPAGFAMVAAAMTAPILARRFRPAHVIAGGLLFAAIGYLMLTQIDQASGLAVLVVAVVITSIGSGPQAALTTDLVLGSAPPEKAGSAASVSESSGELGMAMGAAGMGSIATGVYVRQLDGIPGEVPEEATSAAGESIVGAVGAAGQLPESLSAALLEPAREAFTTGMNVVAGVSALLLTGVAVIGVLALRHVRPTGAATQDETEAANSTGSEDAAEGAVPTPR